MIAALEELKEFATGYQQAAYQRAIDALRAANPTNTSSPVIPSVIGASIRAKIAEFLATGRIGELETQRSQARARAELGAIMGAGPACVGRWIDMGILSVADLRRACAAGSVTLTRMQKLGVRYYDDLNQRIPRNEVEAIGAAICRAATSHPRATCTLAGSYRRGAATSGDVDCLVVGCSTRELLSVLETDPKFVDTIMIGDEKASVLYKGTRVRQVDLLCVDAAGYFAALCYFTGGAIHNVQMRAAAKEQGYRLNQAGLYKMTPDGPVIVPLRSEKELYDTLGVCYVEPTDR
jgi:DNA polymerase/3'-5' exonuclease PolX